MAKVMSTKKWMQGVPRTSSTDNFKHTDYLPQSGLPLITINPVRVTQDWLYSVLSIETDPATKGLVQCAFQALMALEGLNLPEVDVPY